MFKKGLHWYIAGVVHAVLEAMRLLCNNYLACKVISTVMNTSEVEQLSKIIKKNGYYKYCGGTVAKKRGFQSNRASKQLARCLCDLRKAVYLHAAHTPI